jgi:hypothetical protein
MVSPSTTFKTVAVASSPAVVLVVWPEAGGSPVVGLDVDAVVGAWKVVGVELAEVDVAVAPRGEEEVGEGCGAAVPSEVVRGGMAGGPAPAQPVINPPNAMPKSRQTAKTAVRNDPEMRMSGRPLRPWLVVAH